MAQPSFLLLVILATFLSGAVPAASDGAPGTEQHVVHDENDRLSALR